MISVLTYDTLEECLAAFHNCKVDELLSKKPWTWEQNGRITVWGMRRMIRCRKKEGTWGFCEDKGDIHVWVAPHAKPISILRLLAHEIGHRQRPFKRNKFAEERKAENYADVAMKSFEIMEDILKRNLKGKIT